MDKKGKINMIINDKKKNKKRKSAWRGIKKKRKDELIKKKIKKVQTYKLI